MHSTLNIVSFDSPLPANYGGVIDVYNKIRSLKSLGCNIILHFFTSEIPSATYLQELALVCNQIHYYIRDNQVTNGISTTPYIVNSRNDKRLLKNLNSNNHPILFEGLHTTYFANHKDLRNRIKILRMHNIEWDYYNQLAKNEKSIKKKLYFKTEALKLKSWEKKSSLFNHILTISPNDDNYFRRTFPAVKTTLIPPFHFTDRYASKSGKGNHLLIHGDLSINDTSDNLIHMLKDHLSKLKIPVIIAGKNPNTDLIKSAEKFGHIQLIANPAFNTMKQLIEDAHINLIFSKINAGMKLKLVNALFQSRYVIANEPSIYNTGLDELVIRVDNMEDLNATIENLWNRDFDPTENAKRQKTLTHLLDNQNNARKITTLL